MMRRLATAALLTFALTANSAADDAAEHALTSVPLGAYQLDMSQSVISFRIVNFGVSSLSGTFSEADGELGLMDTAAPANNTIAVRTQAASAQMANDRFRRIMLGPAFFDAENHPVLTFEATNVSAGGGTIEGLMTMRGVTAPVLLQSEFHGASTDATTGQTILHYTAHTIIDRTNWGMTGYRWIAGTDVELSFDARFVQDAPTASVN